MKWTEITIITSSEAVDSISNYIQDLGFFVSIQDPADLFSQNQKFVSDMIIDKKFFESDDVIIKTYIDNNSSDTDIAKQLKNYINKISQWINVGEGKIKVSRTDQSDWENEWKKYYKPTKVGDKIVIKPVWEDYVKESDEIVVELNPGLAFGTGTHETTKMCIKLLEKYTSIGDNIIDVGCGSGILSICASKLGANKVVSVDIDPVAVKASKQNIELNDLENVEAIEGDLFEVVNGKYNIVVANIISDIIIDISYYIDKYLTKEGIFICSGIIKERHREVKEILIKNKFNIIKETFEGEWVAIASQK